MAKKKGPPQTITINARRNRKDKSLMNLINEYAEEFCEGMEPKIALAYFIKEYMPAKIAELKKRR